MKTQTFAAVLRAFVPVRETNCWIAAAPAESRNDRPLEPSLNRLSA
jgi:hypothetical protein